MSTITTSEFKTLVEGHLGGTNTARLKDYDTTLKMAMRMVLSKVDPKELITVTPLPSLVYDKVNDYALPSDVSHKGIIDIKRQGVDLRSRNYGFHRGVVDFDMERGRSTGNFNIKYNRGIKSIRLSEPLREPLVVHNADGYNTNGTWEGDGSAVSGIATDSILYFAGIGSVRFNLSSTGSAYLEIDDMSSVNLSSIEDIGSLFMLLYWPGAGSTLTSVDLRWGNNSSNYWNKTITAPHNESAFAQYLNILRFDWDSATEVGSPSSSTINYLRITLTYTGAQNGVRFDNILGQLGASYELTYYSNYGFRTSAGVWTDTPSADGYINLEGDAIQLLLFQFMDLVQYEITRTNNKVVNKPLYGKELKDMYEEYAMNYPSEAIKMSSKTFEFDHNMVGDELSGDYYDDW